MFNKVRRLLVAGLNSTCEDVHLHNTTLARFTVRALICKMSNALLLYFLCAHLLRGCSHSSSLSEAKAKLGLSSCPLRQRKAWDKKARNLMKKWMKNLPGIFFC